jgi:flagellar biosynthesis/type III secretory pathway M-ring protein FliF/YscJ
MDNTSSFGPGLGAFAIFFILAIVLWLLMRNMNSRLRRMNYAKRVEAEQASRRDGQADTDDKANDAAT